MGSSFRPSFYFVSWSGIAVNDIKLLQDISQEIRVQKETRFLYELEGVFTHPIVLSNRLLRNLKLLLYDSGTIGNSVTISKCNRHGLSAEFYGKIISTLLIN